MEINDYFFHDATILEVKEDPATQSILFLLSYPVNWEENIFEPRILLFKDVIHYKVDEIPFSGQVTILKVIDLGQFTKTFSDQWSAGIKRIQMDTNAGIRIIECKSFELLTV